MKKKQAKIKLILLIFMVSMVQLLPAQLQNLSQTRAKNKQELLSVDKTRHNLDVVKASKSFIDSISGLKNFNSRFAVSDSLPPATALRATPYQATSVSTSHLDSLVVYNNEGLSEQRTIYHYNPQGYIKDEILSEKNINTGVWENTSNIYREYDSMGRVSLEINSIWNQEKNDWDVNQKSIFEYDANNYQTLSEQYYWSDFDNAWVGAGKNINAYDEQGYPLLMMMYYWDYENHDWTGSSKTVYAYNSKLEHSLVENYSWGYDAKDWVIMYRLVTVYDDENNILETLFYNGDYETHELILTSRTEMLYENGLLVSETEYQLMYQEDNTEVLLPSTKKINTYNSNRDKVLSEIFVYDYATQGLVISSKSEFQYDEDNHLISTLSTNWDSANQVWIDSAKTEYRYDTQGNAIQTISSSYNSSMLEWIPTSKYVYEFDSNNFKILDESYYWYSQSWVGNSKHVFLRNSTVNDSIDVHEFYTWDHTRLDWKGQSKRVFSLDKLANSSLRTESSWDDSARKFIDVQKIYTEYDVEDRMTYYDVLYWDVQTTAWIPNVKSYYTYYAGDKYLSYLSYSWVENEWVGNNKQEYGYNENGDSKFLDTYTWNQTLKDFEKIASSVYYYSSLTLSNDQLSFMPEGESLTVDVSAFAEITATVQDAWLTIDIEAINNNGQILFTAIANDTKVDRSTEVRVISGSIESIITITQKALPYVEASVNKIDVTESSQTQLATISSNTTWTLSSNVDWITFVSESGTENGEISIQVTANSSSSRSGEVSITGDGMALPFVITVNQKGGMTTGLEVDANNKSSITVYPNQVTDGFRINGIEDGALVNVVDMNGRSLFTKQVSNDEYIDTDKLSVGTYLVRIKTGATEVVRRINKQ